MRHDRTHPLALLAPCSLRSRPPAGSTLFPYTTLFRSVFLTGIPELNQPPTVQASEMLRLNTDRKSTRLNSSHPPSSYAVFCLQKKKMKTRIGGSPSQRHGSGRPPPAIRHSAAPRLVPA